MENLQRTSIDNEPTDTDTVSLKPAQCEAQAHWDHPVMTPTLPSSHVANARLDLSRRYRVSKFLQLRPTKDHYMAESLITGRRHAIPNAASMRLLLSLTAPARLQDLLCSVSPKSVPALVDFFGRCLDAKLITEVAEDGSADEDSIDSLRHWETHDLAFHLWSRRGRNERRVGATWHLAGVVAAEPAKRTDSRELLGRIMLPRPDPRHIAECDLPLDSVLQKRRSRYSVAPVTLPALAELLFRACRVTQVDDSAGLIRKVYPSGGSLHSLEVYVIAHRCVGLDSGGYRYDAFEHCLEWLRRPSDDLTELLKEAKAGAGLLQDLPSVQFIFASRFRRVTRKYQSLAYRVVLQELGALYQTLYLVAETLGLGVSAVGSGNSERFARAFGTDFFAELSVGEMIVGGRAGE